MFVIAGIDGTGPYNEAEYQEHFRNSYVRRFTSGIDAPSSGFYKRGPTTEGASTRSRGTEAAEHVAAFVKDCARANRRPGVFLTGFSRGGAAVIHAAQILHERKIIVDAMFLFDAVDRAVGVSTEIIPANVRTIYHAMRSSLAESREIFSNTGTRYYKDKTAYHPKWFRCTHGAIGGTPWTKAGSDGKIYEGDSRISIGMTILLPSALGFVAREYYQNNSRTTVTLEQERMGSESVLRWMGRNLDLEKERLATRQRLEKLSS